MLIKQKAYVMGESIISWIQTWLTNRRQRVIVEVEISNWKPVMSGVPHRPVLGPTLFLIFMNDLDDNFSSRLFKFADNTNIFITVKAQMHIIFFTR